MAESLQARFYVATTGNDAWSGRHPQPAADATDGPFATLSRAHDAVRELAARMRSRDSAPEGEIRVEVRGGRYYLPEPLALTGNKHEVWDHRPAPDATCLIVVDMRGPPEPWADEPHASVLGNCRRLLAAPPPRPARVPRPPPRSGTGGQAAAGAVLPGLAPATGETVLQPAAGGAFATTGLAGLLHTMGVRDLFLCGEQTYDNLLRIGNEAAHWGYAVTVTQDASAAPASREAHLVVLRFFDQVWGRVRSTDEVIRELTPGAVSRV